MERRRLLEGALGVGVAALAGCLGRQEDPFTLKVVNLDFGGDADGYLQVTVTVSNVGNDPQEGTLYVNSKLNDEALVRVRDVALEAHATRDYTISYDVKYDDVTSFSPHADIEPKDG